MRRLFWKTPIVRPVDVCVCAARSRQNRAASLSIAAFQFAKRHTAGKVIEGGGVSQLKIYVHVLASRAKIRRDIIYRCISARELGVHVDTLKVASAARDIGPRHITG